MASLKDRVTGTVARLREKQPWFDHTLRMLAHYGSVNGSGQAGSVTYFGFLSVFPILALGAFVIGIVASVYPDIRGQMTSEINSLLPGVIGTGPGKIDLDKLGQYSGLTGVIGLLGVAYSGLGWLSGLRAALEVMFVVPKREQPNFVFGKLRDLLTLALIGVTLIVSVVLSGLVTGFSGQLLNLVGISQTALLPTIALSVLGHLLGIAASTALLLLMFKLLVTESHVPRSPLVRGALLGAVLFEALKAGANLLIAQTQGNVAFATFGVALILVVWINYFSRFVMYGAAWAYTAPDALAQRTSESMRAPGAVLTPAAPISDDESRQAVTDVVDASRNEPEVPAHVPGATPGRSDAEPERQRSWVLAAGSAALGAVAALAIRGRWQR